MSSFYSELKRRNVVKVGIAYAITGWVVVEIAAVVLPIFSAPQWILQVFTLLIILGAPFALIIAWAFELTPDGLMKTADVPAEPSITHTTGRKLDFTIIAILAVAVVFLVVDKFLLLDKSSSSTEVASTMSPSIAVLPFANRSANEDDVFFVDGIHDDLLSHVSKIGSIKTISRTSVLQYRDTEKTIPQIAAELGVATVLEGGVQRAGDQVRINVQLIDAVTDEHLWSEIYDRRLTASNIFEIQSEIATAIASALRAQLSPEEQDNLKKIPTENLEALEAYFLGKQLMETRKIAALAEAADLLEKTVALDPDFALAYVSLADTYRLQGAYGGGPYDEMNVRAQAAIDMALQLDAGLGEAYATLGYLRRNRRDIEGAEAAFKRALKLQPNYAPAYQWYGEFLASVAGRQDDAVVQSRKAVTLDPLSAIINNDLAETLESAGRVEEAFAQYQKAIEIDPEFAIAHVRIAGLYWLSRGRVDEAIPWLYRSMALDPEGPFIAVFIGNAYLDLGDDRRAAEQLGIVEQSGRESRYLNASIAKLHLFRRDETAAIEFALKSLAIDPRYSRALVLLGNMDLKAGRVAEARARYEEIYPELLDTSEPPVTGSNYRVAVNFAHILSKSGEQDQADLLFDRSLELIRKGPRLGAYGYRVTDVQVYAQRGQKEQALTALRQAVDEGWRYNWWYHFEHDASLESIRDEAEFQAMLAEVKADMAGQLARVREMEASGEIAAPKNN